MTEMETLAKLEKDEIKSLALLSLDGLVKNGGVITTDQILSTYVRIKNELETKQQMAIQQIGNQSDFRFDASKIF